jgi:bacillithiol system protein YtxJ
MAITLRELRTMEDLDAALAASGGRPLLVFKHSLTCGTSAFAFEELERLAAAPPEAMEIGVVAVQHSRALSQAIAERWQIRHESPQALLVVDGQLRWHASHYRLTREVMADAISRAVSQAG